ncbi:hypothetical protein YC2023_105454 [Brassica napus]
MPRNMYLTRMFLRLRECSVQCSILGEWSGLDYGVELQDTLMLGTDYYLTESGIASLLAEGKIRDLQNNIYSHHDEIDDDGECI